MDSENDKDGQYDPVRDFSMEVSRERVEKLWKQAQTHKRSARSDLAVAKATRAKAELERQRIASEAMEATRAACIEIIGEAERQLSKAKEADVEAQRMRAEAEEEWTRANMARPEADAYSERVIVEADGEAQRIRAEVSSYREKTISEVTKEADGYREKVMNEVRHDADMTRSEADSYQQKTMTEARQEAKREKDEAHTATLQECAELKREVTYEIQCILDEADAIKAAAQEELEAQMIYAEVAKLKAMSQDVHAQVIERVEKALGERHAWSTESSTETAGMEWVPEDIRDRVMEKMAWVRGATGDPSTNGHPDMEVMAEEVQNGAVGSVGNGHVEWDGVYENGRSWESIESADTVSVEGHQDPEQVVQPSDGIDGSPDDAVDTPRPKSSKKGK